MRKKILFIVLDGLGDRPLKELDNKTPLEAAKTPHMDLLVENGMCGLLLPVFEGALPTSEGGHFALFGYDPRKYKIRRGVFTACGAGIKMKKGDVALRGNFGTVDEKMNMIDRRAGRIDKTQPLIDKLDGMVINGVRFHVKHAGGHRVGIVMEGKGLSPQISDGDPHYGNLGKKARKVVPLDRSAGAKRTADALNLFLEEAHQILKDHPLNKKREKKGLSPANYILTRGASSIPELLSFKKRYGLGACCIAGKPLYKQVGRFLGMDLIEVEGANGLSTTNLKGKIEAAKKGLKRYDFVFLHIKATDSLAEDGDFMGKMRFIEKIDKHLKPILGLEDVLVVVTADHSTCSGLRRHCNEPIPVLIYGQKKDNVKLFSERACKKGGLGEMRQTMILKKILKLA